VPVRKTRKTLTSKQVGLKYGFRSGLEKTTASDLKSRGVAFSYEEHIIQYEQPAKKRKYTPDFEIHTKSGRQIFIETKGRFVTADRQKHLLIKAQHPDLDIRFVFSNSRARISKLSKTTYAMWCEKNEFKYADKTIPEEWLNE